LPLEQAVAAPKRAINRRFSQKNKCVVFFFSCLLVVVDAMCSGRVQIMHRRLMRIRLIMNLISAKGRAKRGAYYDNSLVGASLLAGLWCFIAFLSPT
jgi:hypothetical protein